ncbi:MAG: hypothetical protein QOH33_2170 [Paraburkholderia sp.]|nr:hypothetical protein [Paraburkholderia sp.]
MRPAIVHHTTLPAGTVPGPAAGDDRCLQPRLRRGLPGHRKCVQRRAILQSPFFMGRKLSTPRAPSARNVWGKPSEERLNARLSAPKDQRVNVMCALVSIDDLEVDEVPGDTELVGDAIAAEHVARETCDIERLAA